MTRSERGTLRKVLGAKIQGKARGGRTKRWKDAEGEMLIVGLCQNDVKNRTEWRKKVIIDTGDPQMTEQFKDKKRNKFT